MTPGARITAGLLLAVVIVSVGYLFNSQMSGPSADLLHGMRVSDSQIQTMMGALGNANLNDAVPKNGTIYVPHGMEAKYMGALASAKALPHDFNGAIDNAINGSNPFESENTRTTRMNSAKQEELKNIIASMPGISNASVLIDSVVNSGFKRERVITASVYVLPAGSQELDEEKASAIRLLVKSSVAGLKYENVTVSDQNGHTFSGDSEHGSSAGDNPLIALQRNREKILKQKIEGALSRIPGVTVATTVTLDPNEKTRTTEVKQEKALPIHESESTTSHTADTGGTGGPAGFASQQPNAAVSLSKGPIGGSKDEENSSKTESTSIPSNNKQTDIVKDGHTPILETVAIGIPSGYFKKAWQAANPPAAGQEPKDPDAAALAAIKTETFKQVKAMVAPLLTRPEGNTDPKDLVAVTDFPEIPIALPPEPSLAKSAMTWLGDYWNVVGMIGLAGVSLLMLRSLVKSAPPVDQAAMPRLAETPEEEETNEASPKKPTPIRVRHFSAGPSLRDEISMLVKEDPDTAANVLKTWIGHAG
jgi:flagellar M-ring protein FliF